MELDKKKVELLMIRNCWSIAELQRHAGLAGNTFYKIRNGLAKASPKTIGKIAKALQVNPVDIIKK